MYKFMVKILNLTFMVMFLFLMFFSCLTKNFYFIELEMNPNFSSFSWVWVGKIDFISVMFSSVILLITIMILIYSLDYMSMDYNKKFFQCVMVIFFLSMICLVYSFSITSILLGWDGLGLSSFLLIAYYNSQKSMNSSLITMLINRIGDLMIIFSISLSLISNFSWNCSFWVVGQMWVILLLVASFSKSAQIPFSSWLPKAMSAPTPVSSLVHSSTLVTAGAYLTLRLPIQSWDNFSSLTMYISSMTFFLSSMMALSSFDIKEIIAFSTMSHMSLVFMGLSMKLFNQSFFHLCTHALFKALLFMCSGYMIYYYSGIQDIRHLNLTYENLTIKIPFIGSILSMMGLPFLSGFYSKEMILDSVLCISKLSFILIMFSIFFSCLYSVRLLYFPFMNFKIGLLMAENKFMNLAILNLSYFSILFGTLFQWTKFPVMFIFPSLSLKMYIIMVIILSLMICLSVKINFDFFKILKFFNFWFKILFITYEINFYMFKKSELFLFLEKGWLNLYTYMMISGINIWKGEWFLKIYFLIMLMYFMIFS